jgi:hypothetical protein
MRLLMAFLLLAGSASGSEILSGTLDISFASFYAPLSTVFSFQLSDGFSLSGYGWLPDATPGQIQTSFCYFTYPCQILLIPTALLNNDSGF